MTPDSSGNRRALQRTSVNKDWHRSLFPLNLLTIPVGQGLL